MIVPQKGQSIICSSCMLVGYLVSKVTQMKKSDEDECSAANSDDETPCSDAANIDSEKKMIVYHSAKMIERFQKQGPGDEAAEKGRRSYNCHIV